MYLKQIETSIIEHTKFQSKYLKQDPSDGQQYSNSQYIVTTCY